MKLQRRLNGVKAFRFKVFVLVLFLVFYLLLVNIFVGPERSLVSSFLSKINSQSKRPGAQDKIRRESVQQPFKVHETLVQNSQRSGALPDHGTGWHDEHGPTEEFGNRVFHQLIFFMRYRN